MILSVGESSLSSGLRVGTAGHELPAPGNCTRASHGDLGPSRPWILSGLAEPGRGRGGPGRRCGRNTETTTPKLVRLSR